MEVSHVFHQSPFGLSLVRTVEALEPESRVRECLTVRDNVLQDEHEIIMTAIVGCSTFRSLRPFIFFFRTFVSLLRLNIIIIILIQ